jgi:hypothetical protein
MGVQFERLVFSSQSSLTLIVSDLLRQTRDGAGPVADTDIGMEDWVNALSRQTAPLLQSAAGRENLEAWLAEVDLAGL